MHYSFDFAQQVHFPYSPQQPGQLFFAHLENVVNLECFVRQHFLSNYFIDESDMAGKEANATISLVHDYLEKHVQGEIHVLLHADSCIWQNNIYVISCLESDH